MLLLVTSAIAAPPIAGHQVVRIADLQIDPARLGAYRSLLAEEIEASVRLEPGVVSLNAVSIADDPARIRILEIYASQSACEAHLKAPHFLKCKMAAASMVRSLDLQPAIPIKLCAKTPSASTIPPFRCIQAPSAPFPLSTAPAAPDQDRHA